MQYILRVDGNTRLIACLDDTASVVNERHAKDAIEICHTLWAAHGCTLNVSKTHAWSVKGTDLGLPESMQVRTLPILGDKLRCSEDLEDAPCALGAEMGHDLGAATQRIK